MTFKISTSKIKVLEFLKGNPTLVIMGVVIIMIALFGYQCGIAKEAKRTAKVFEEQAEKVKKDKDEEIRELAKENVDLEEDNLKKDKLIAAKEQDNERLIQQRIESEERLRELEEKLEKATPTELVTVTRRILITEEVWWDKESELAEFTLVAFRSNTFKLVDWEDFTNIREPSYKEQIKNDAVIRIQSDGKILNLVTEVGNQKLMLTKERESYESLQNSFQEWKRYVKKKSGFFTFDGIGGKVLLILAGYGASKILDK